MKKLLALALAALLLLIPACKPAAGNEQTGDNSGVRTYDPASQTEHPYLVAKKNQLRFGEVTVFKDNRGFALKGLCLNGNQVGSEDDPELVRNDKPAELNGVRCIFELNEWITFRLTYGYDGGAAKLGVWMFPHRDLGVYGRLDTMENTTYFAEYELPYETYPEPLEDEFCIAPENAEPGAYDLLFTIDGNIIGGMLITLVSEHTLGGMTAEQLQKLLSAD